MNETDANTALATLVDLATEDERKGLPSASSWRRYELCPGSHQLAQEARRLSQEAYTEPSQASDRGDRIHAALAEEEDELEDELDQLDESETATFEFLRERSDDQVRRIFGDEPVTELKEQRLWFKLGGKEAASGRFDRVVQNGKLALVQDFKTGWMEPDPAEVNAQLKFLAVLVAMHLPQVTEVVAQIVSGPYGVTETRFGLAELAQAYNDVVATLRKLRDPQAAFNASPEACKWCPAVAICDAVKNLILPIARLQHSPLPDGERASRLLDEVELLQRHLEEIRKYYAKRLLKDDQYKIPGYGMEVGAPRRKVTDWVAAKAKLEEFVSSEALDELTKFSIPAVQKLLGKTIGVSESKRKEELKRVLGDLLQERYPAPSLKRVRGEPKIATLADSLGCASRKLPLN